VESKFVGGCFHARQREVEIVNRAIGIAESIGVCRDVISSAEGIECARAAFDAAIAENAPYDGSSSCEFAAKSAAFACRAAVAAVENESSETIAWAAATAATAPRTSRYSIEQRCLDLSIVMAQWRDFDFLREVSQRESWTDSTPVPPQFFSQHVVP
jgi:hypothetical protein